MISYQTEKGLQNLRNELQQLELHDRKRIALEIDEARQKGDLSENAEYHAAKEAQAQLELKIAKLKETINNARLLDLATIDVDHVSILATVTLYHKKLKKEVVYTIVPHTEANLSEAKISVESPIAKGLLGKKVDQEVSIQVPSGLIEVKILNISYPDEVMAFHQKRQKIS